MGAFYILFSTCSSQLCFKASNRPKASMDLAIATQESHLREYYSYEHLYSTSTVLYCTTRPKGERSYDLMVQYDHST